MEVDNDQRPVLSPQRSASIVYILLVAMGLAVFAPCVLLPEWRKYQELDSVAQIEQHKLDQINAAIEKLQTQLRAVQNDPGVLKRLAHRELNLAPEGTTAVRVDAREIPDGRESGFQPVPPRLPETLQRAATFLPPVNYDRVFCDPETRRFLMIMSLMLIVIACAVIRPHRAQQTNAVDD